MFVNIDEVVCYHIFRLTTRYDVGTLVVFVYEILSSGSIL